MGKNWERFAKAIHDRLVIRDGLLYHTYSVGMIPIK
jgi:hypothetical protein